VFKKILALIFLSKDLHKEERYKRASYIRTPQANSVVSSNRICFCFIILLVFNVVLAARLLNLQGKDYAAWSTKAKKQHKKKLKISSARSKITDSKGRILAISLPTLSVGIHPHKVKNISKSSMELSALLGLEQEQIEKKLIPGAKFTWLAKGVNRSQRKRLKALNYSELEIFNDYKRINPQGGVAKKLIGKVGWDGTGLTGLEAYYESSLKSTDVILAAQRDARGRSIFNIGNISLKDPIDNSLNLTMDSFIQKILESEMEKGKEESEARRVFGVLMDAENGDVLAMGHSDNNEKENYKIVSAFDSFEPGSTFKPLVAAAALDYGAVSENEVIDCGNGLENFGSYKVRDVHKIGKVTLDQVLVQSSNIGMAKISNRIGKEKLYNTISDLGFGNKTGIELSGESKGILRHHKDWRAVCLANHGFGQGIAVTSLQLVRAYSAILNGGYLPEVSLIKKENKTAKRVFSQYSAEKILEMIKGVTEDENGTGKAAKISGLTVYGKTGTAQQPFENGKGYDPDRILASFIGGVDLNEIGINKKLVMFIAVDEPQVKPRWGGRLAGPIFKRSMERIVSYILGGNSDLIHAKSEETKLFDSARI